MPTTVPYDLIPIASASSSAPGLPPTAVVDPDRDIQKYLDAASERGLSITHIIETHLHADHVSGHGRLAAATGAIIHRHRLAAHEPLGEQRAN